MSRSRHPISHYMSASVHSIGRDQPLEVAHEQMQKHGIRHLPVLEGGKIVGLVSQRDLYLTEALEPIDLSKVRVEEAMTQEPFLVTRNASLESVAATMAERKLGCAIVTEDDKVVGLFTTVDALRALSTILQTARKDERA